MLKRVENIVAQRGLGTFEFQDKLKIVKFLYYGFDYIKKLVHICELVRTYATCSFKPILESQVKYSEANFCADAYLQLTVICLLKYL